MSAGIETAFRSWSLLNLPYSTAIVANPTFKINGVVVVLHPLEIVSVANENLGERVGSLADDADAIIAALDELFSRAFG